VPQVHGLAPHRAGLARRLAASDSQLRSNRVMALRRPDWWCYPELCTDGHERGPGLILVSRERCRYAPARAAHPDRAAWGHLTVACRVPGCESVWYDPPHEPGGGLAD